ncbi:MAG: hypothetical protein [Caudoviricetes sp.]|nr:MAG: hypothetical protein [Caudoviricetes sp.]
MKNLTAEQRKELLDEIDYNRKNCFLSSKTELLMQIAESYLKESPMLQQLERNEGDWMHWNGESALPPVDVRAMVEVRLRNGVSVLPRQAQNFAWRNSPVKSGFDIIAYRITPERAANQNGEQ